jgi:hypothetical protein
VVARRFLMGPLTTAVEVYCAVSALVDGGSLGGKVLKKEGIAQVVQMIDAHRAAAVLIRGRGSPGTP